MYNTDYCSFL